MLTALLRKSIADLRGNLLQHSLIFVILVAATMMLSVALIVQRSVDSPWDRAFQETNGPHVWLISSRFDVDFSQVSRLEGISETSGEIPAISNHPLVVGDEKYDFLLYGMVDRPPVARPKVVGGRWLDPSAAGEIVLDNSLARYHGFSVGDTVQALTAEGNRPLKVVGLAVNSHWLPYDDNTRGMIPGMGYVLPTTLNEIEPNPGARVKVLGVRLNDPQTSSEFGKKALGLLGGQLASSLEWRWVRDTVTFANRLNVLFLSFFSLLSLVAVGFIVANTIGAHVLARYREIGLMKAVGLKPSQVMLLFLIEHLGVGLLATAVGLGLGIAAAPAFASPIAKLLNTTAPPVYDPLLILGIALIIEGTIVLFTILPAWHGSRINTVQAITIGVDRQQAGSSLPARLARWLRLPAVLVLGVKDVFTRPLRATLTILGLLVTVVVAVFTAGAQSTIERLGENPMYYQGTPADVLVDRGFAPDEQARSMLSRRPEIEGYYTELDIYGRTEGGTDPFLHRVLDGDYRKFDFRIQEGRMIEAPDEAVVGYGLLALVDKKAGDDLSLTVDGKPLALKIVGRHMELGSMGRVVMYSLDTYRRQIDPNAVPRLYGLDLAGGADAKALRAGLLSESNGQFSVKLTNTGPNASVMQLRAVALSLCFVLSLIAGINLLSTGLLGIRERVRDFAVQKTLGVTPAQIGIGVVAGVGMLAILSLLLGIPLGLLVYDRFMSSVAEQVGTGPGFAHMDWQWLSLLLPGMAVLAILGSAIPARRAARLVIADALRYE
ncbi:MAG: FtsX-like permease family protein [Chloroflexi bacterium]|nr:FtsX-like permease family protein [Chloroflexota bacterium]